MKKPIVEPIISSIRRLSEAESDDEVADVLASRDVLRDSSVVASVVFKMLDIHQRLPFLLPLVVVSLFARFAL
jgi:hypothetical protein